MTYTREQVLAMDAEQLAEATAIHVMGWTKNKSEHELFNCWLDAEGNWKFDCHDEDGHRWNPAEDIAAAWDLLKEISEKGLVWRIEGARVSVFDPYVGSPSDDGSLVHYEIIGSGIADTICKAALLAVLDL